VNRRSIRRRRRIGSSSLVCVFELGGGRQVCSMCCRKISDMILEEGVPIARPSVWVMVLSLCWNYE